MKSTILFVLMVISLHSFSQWKDYKLINDGKDTLNRMGQDDKKQGEWMIHHDNLRGEPGYEEEGIFIDNRKEGEWKLFNLMGDLVGIEHYRWGFKDGLAQYYNIQGDLRIEQSWKALNPDKQYDTIQVEDVDKLDSYHEVIIKNEGVALKHGVWKYYDANGGLIKSETYVLGKLEHDHSATPAAVSETPKNVAKPKEVVEFEKKNKGKKIRYQDGSTN